MYFEHNHQNSKEKILEDILLQLGGVLIAFSGGVDSTYLAKKALDVLGYKKVLAVTAASETYPARELREARSLAENLKIRHQVVMTSELAIQNFAGNSPERCYYCKMELFRTLDELGQQEGLVVVDGSNADDLKDYRPGSKAAVQMGVVSPLEKAGMTKEDIRRLSRAMALPNWSKPSFACLASRFPYGQEITAEKLSQVGQVEEFLIELGFTQVRVRHHERVARIEVKADEMGMALALAGEIYQKCKESGFFYAALDLLGYRQGSMNEVLPESDA